MRTPRSNFHAFNPDKFLEKELQKTELSIFPSTGELLPIVFSKERRKSFISKLAIKSPAVFYSGSILEKEKIAIATLKMEICKEVERIGVTADAILVNLLLADVVRDPAWRRIRRKMKNPDQPLKP